MPMRKENLRRTSRTPTQHPWSSCHHYTSVSVTSHYSQDLNLPKFEMLAPLQRQLCFRLAICALQSQYDLLRCLGLLMEHGFRLTTITGLLAVISTLSLGEQRCLENVRLRMLHLAARRTFPALYCVTLC
jgi:hypothetical protein